MGKLHVVLPLLRPCFDAANANDLIGQHSKLVLVWQMPTTLWAAEEKAEKLATEKLAAKEATKEAEEKLEAETAAAEKATKEAKDELPAKKRKQKRLPKRQANWRRRKWCQLSEG